MEESPLPMCTAGTAAAVAKPSHFLRNQKLTSCSVWHPGNEKAKGTKQDIASIAS